MNETTLELPQATRNMQEALQRAYDIAHELREAFPSLYVYLGDVYTFTDGQCSCTVWIGDSYQPDNKWWQCKQSMSVYSFDVFKGNVAQARKLSLIMGPAF